MAGGTPTGGKQINIDVSRGGLLTGAIMKDNTFHGQVTSRNNYTGPPPREEAGPVVPREESDRAINIRNEGGQLHQNILLNNTFEGNVDFEQNINIQPLELNDNEERMDLR